MANIKVQILRGTQAKLSSTNPVLLSGELGLEKNTHRIKAGNGTTEWNDLPYIGYAIEDSRPPEITDSKHPVGQLWYDTTSSTLYILKFFIVNKAVWEQIVTVSDLSSTGDMQKAVYDTTNAGVVDKAQSLSPGAKINNVLFTGENDITIADDTKLSLSGGVMHGDIILSDLPSNSSGAVPKYYVDSHAEGMTYLKAVECATTSNIALNGIPAAADMDGITVADSDRVLVMSQTDPKENGIYVVNTASNWTRATDADTGAKLENAFVFVTNGSANGKNGFVCNSKNITIGTTDILWVNHSAASGYVPGAGIDITGNVLSIASNANLPGIPTADTAAAGAKTKQLATTEFVSSALDDLVIDGGDLDLP